MCTKWHVAENLLKLRIHVQYARTHTAMWERDEKGRNKKMPFNYAMGLSLILGALSAIHSADYWLLCTAHRVGKQY